MNTTVVLKQLINNTLHLSLHNILNTDTSANE